MPKKFCAELNTNLSTVPWKTPRINRRAKAFHRLFNITSSPCGEKNVRSNHKAKSESRLPPLPFTFSQSVEVNECIWHTFVSALPRRTELRFSCCFAAEVGEQRTWTYVEFPNTRKSITNCGRTWHTFVFTSIENNREGLLLPDQTCSYCRLNVSILSLY